MTLVNSARAEDTPAFERIQLTSPLVGPDGHRGTTAVTRTAVEGGFTARENNELEKMRADIRNEMVKHLTQMSIWVGQAGPRRSEGVH